MQESYADLTEIHFIILIKPDKLWKIHLGEMKMLLTLLVHQEPKPDVSIPIREWAECDICPRTKILAQSHTLHFRSLNVTNGDSGYSRIPNCEPGTSRMQIHQLCWVRARSAGEAVQRSASAGILNCYTKHHQGSDVKLPSCFPSTRFKHGLYQFGLQSFHCTWSPCTRLVIAMSNTM